MGDPFPLQARNHLACRSDVDEDRIPQGEPARRLLVGGLDSLLDVHSIFLPPLGLKETRGPKFAGHVW